MSSKLVFWYASKFTLFCDDSSEAAEKVSTNVDLQLEHWDDMLFKLNKSRGYRRTLGSIVGSCLTAATPLLASVKEAASLVALDIVEVFFLIGGSTPGSIYRFSTAPRNCRLSIYRRLFSIVHFVYNFMKLMHEIYEQYDSLNDNFCLKGILWMIKHICREQWKEDGPMLGAMVKALVVQRENAGLSLESSHFVQQKPEVRLVSCPPLLTPRNYGSSTG